jgi:uncharacterized repeat protein (TIGR03803 family)
MEGTMRVRTLSALLGLLLAHAAQAGVVVLHGFDYDDGQYPEGRILQGQDGRFYGTTYGGGANHLGTVFSVGPDGSFSLLHSFDGTDGYSLDSGLAQRPDGRLVGSTPQGSIVINHVSTGFGGTVFQLAPDGSGFTTLKSFAAGDAVYGAEPGAPVDGGDGNFYAVQRTGGPNGLGTVIRVAGDGTVSVIHAFSSSEGYSPQNGLTRGSDGNLYGALAYGPGGNPNGALFRLTLGGALTVLHTFNQTDGRLPASQLAEMGDGYLYGVTIGGGPADAGTVFRIDSGGTLTTLHAFTGSDANEPVGLARGPDGLLYGLSFSGGPSGGGTIFRIDSTGKLLVLHLLAGIDGTHPLAAPIFGSDNRLYGTTTQYGGAPGAAGSVFAFDALSPQPPELQMQKICYNEFDTCFTPINTVVGQMFTVAWQSANLTKCTGSGKWRGNEPTSGRIDVVPLRAGLYTYRLNCSGPNGPASATVTVTVGP